MNRVTSIKLEKRLDAKEGRMKSMYWYDYLPELSKETRVAMVALLAGSQHVIKLFGKSIEDIKWCGGYKPEAGDTPRTLIDKYAQEEILSAIKAFLEFDNDTLNPEESEQSGSGNRIWHIDPYDGTSNAKIKLPMSTMGIGIQKEGELVSSVIVNPFERKIFYAEKGNGAYFSRLCGAKRSFTQIGTFFYLEEDQRERFYKEFPDLDLDSLFLDIEVIGDEGVGWHAEKIKTDTAPNSAKERYAWVDALFNDKTTPRKLKWIEMMQKAGFIQNVRMTGSNIDYSAKLSEGRGDYQLTDAVGGFFDLCGYNLIEESGGRMVNLDGKQPTPQDHVAIAVANPDDLDSVLSITRKCYEGYKGFK